MRVIQRELRRSLEEYYNHTTKGVITFTITREGLKELIDALSKCDRCVARYYLENPNERRTDEQNNNKNSD